MEESALAGLRGRTMWDTVAEVLVSPGAFIVCSLILLVIVVIAILIHTGHLSVAVKGVHVGKHGNGLGERYILLKQIEWTERFLIRQEPRVRVLLDKNPEGVNEEYKREPEYYIRWLFSRMHTYIVVHWLVPNQITPDKRRQQALAEDLLNYLGALTGNLAYDEVVLKEIIIRQTEEVMKNAIRIKKDYEG